MFTDWTGSKCYKQRGVKSKTHSRFGKRGQRDKEDRGQKWFKGNNKNIIGDQDSRLRGERERKEMNERKRKRVRKSESRKKRCGV